MMDLGPAYATELDDGYIGLLVFSHPQLAEPLRYTDAGENLTVGGEVYVFEPIRIKLPDLTEDAPPVGRISLDAVNQQVIAALRTLEGPLTVELTIALLSDPETPEVGPFEFEGRQVRWGLQMVEMDLIFEPTFGVQVPADIYSPANFPGLAR
jgi:hypothetical protein